MFKSGSYCLEASNVLRVIGVGRLDHYFSLDSKS